MVFIVTATSQSAIYTAGFSYQVTGTVSLELRPQNDIVDWRKMQQMCSPDGTTTIQTNYADSFLQVAKRYHEQQTTHNATQRERETPVALWGHELLYPTLMDHLGPSSSAESMPSQLSPSQAEDFPRPAS